jgi:hypothetical protein
MATRVEKRYRLRLEDFSDREILALVRDHEDSDGWADSQVVALAIWPRYAAEEDSTARMSVARRFSYLKRWGAMEKHDKTPRLWRLTDAGRAIVEGRLTRAQQDVIEFSGEEKVLALAEALGRRYEAEEELGATLMRRAMQYSYLRRRRRFHVG